MLWPADDARPTPGGTTRQYIEVAGNVDPPACQQRPAAKERVVISGQPDCEQFLKHRMHELESKGASAAATSRILTPVRTLSAP